MDAIALTPLSTNPFVFAADHAACNLFVVDPNASEVPRDIASPRIASAVAAPFAPDAISPATAPNPFNAELIIPPVIIPAPPAPTTYPMLPTMLSNNMFPENKFVGSHQLAFLCLSVL